MATNATDPLHHRRWKTFAVVGIGLILAGWALFHPVFRPDKSTIAPATREALARTGFASTKDVRAAHFESVYSTEGSSDKGTTNQVIVAIDELLTEKRSRRLSPRLSQESSGLYVGPITVVRYTRTTIPVIGDLLPSQFWDSTHLSDFAIETLDRFPHVKGGTMRARVVYEDRYADGQLAQIERRRLACSVVEIVDATSINPTLSGGAARIDCREELEPNGRQTGPTKTQTYSTENIGFSHWYVFNRRWSIPIEGEADIRLDDADVVRKWSAKLISFESGGT